MNWTGHGPMEMMPQTKQAPFPDATNRQSAARRRGSRRRVTRSFARPIPADRRLVARPAADGNDCGRRLRAAAAARVRQFEPNDPVDRDRRCGAKRRRYAARRGARRRLLAAADPARRHRAPGLAAHRGTARRGRRARPGADRSVYRSELHVHRLAGQAPRRRPGLAALIGTGTAICGASAVVAANTVVGGSDEDSAYAIASVTLFGTLAMVLYPLLAHPLGLDARHYGLWAGASIHEIAQVVAATFQISPDAGHVATIVKLSRVMMLAPMVIAMGLAGRYRRGGAPGGKIAAAPIPWFVFGFLALIGIGSVVSIPPVPMHWIVQATAFLLSMALAAMGLHTDIRKLSAEGVRPFALCAASSAFLAGFSLVLVRLFL